MSEIFCPNCGSKNIKKKYGEYNDSKAIIAYLNIGLGLVFVFDHTIIGGIFILLAFVIAFDAFLDVTEGNKTFKNILNGYRKYTCNECGNTFDVNIEDTN